MKKTLIVFCLLVISAWPHMAVGQGVQPLSPAMPPVAPAPSPFGTGNWVPVPGNFSLGIPYLAPGLGIHAGLLFLQPSADNLGWAVLTNVKNPASPHPVASPFWGIETLNPTYYPAFEVGAHYAFSRPGNDCQVNWQHLRTATSGSAAANSDQWVSPFCQTGPATAQTWDDLATNQGVNLLRTAEGKVDFAYDAVNCDFGQYINIGPWVQTRMLAGVTYARLQEQLVSSFFGAPPDPAAPIPADRVQRFIQLNMTSTYTGVGPRFGLDTTYEIPRGFRLAGQFAGALLIGKKEPSQYLFTAASPDLALVGIPVNLEHIRSGNFAQVVYACDARLGIGFSGATYNMEAGYLASAYFDAFSGYETNNNVLPLQSGSLSTASMRHTLSNFTMNGFYFTGGMAW